MGTATHRKRNCLILHGRQDVHEWHTHDGGLEEIRPHVKHSACRAVHEGVTGGQQTYAGQAQSSAGGQAAGAPIVRPPAERPSMQSLLLEVYFFSTRNSAQEMKSVNVFFFLRNLPSSYLAEQC